MFQNSRDVVNKYAEPSGDKEKLVYKLTHVQKAENDIENGQKKLENALKQGELACRKIDTEEKEMIEQEVAILQEEFDNYV
jgi:nesprin-1